MRLPSENKNSHSGKETLINTLRKIYKIVKFVSRALPPLGKYEYNYDYIKYLNSEQIILFSEHELALLIKGDARGI